MKAKIRNKELSWLAFNARVLQEAADASVPLIERIKFLGIFSSNQDEFFRVRVATLKRLEKLGKKARQLIGNDPAEILDEIYAQVLELQGEFNKTYESILEELESSGIHIVNERELTDEQAAFVQRYFRDEVRPMLIPIMIDQVEEFPELKDHAIYLAVRMWRSNGSRKKRFALIEVPTNVLPRFLILPSRRRKEYVILLDDVIRYSLADTFSMFNYDQFVAYTIKMTRDAELEFDDDLTESFMRKMAKSLEKRRQGRPVRFVYDAAIPKDLLNYVLKRINENEADLDLIPGARYHNFKDFMQFPRIGPETLRYQNVNPLPHRDMINKRMMIRTIQKGDLLLHFPYQSFSYVIDFLREAAIDPKVTSIKITLYRVANKSKVINALINAAMNGKDVTVVMELQARFDEEANLQWSNILQQAGVKVIHGVAGLKVHSKLILISRKEKRKRVLYTSVGTGNFNESTARLYTDHSLFTCDPRITEEVANVFEFIENNYKHTTYNHLLVSPFNMRKRTIGLITQEIKAARAGKEAYIIAKLNNLTDPEVITKLYQANKAGVKVELLVRGMFSVITGVEGMSEHIRATGIIDRFLEHTRLLVFCNKGKPKYYLTSADWMPRNIDNRVEVTCPIYDERIQEELRAYLEIQVRGNVKTRILDSALSNAYVPVDGETVRVQEAIYEYCRAMVSGDQVSPDSGNGVKKAAAAARRPVKVESSPQDPSIV